ncbi:permease-like cell division protein FtsX [Sinanaerobacter chloroacetimidivorans]|jgi:cell division transport system permease protein|uniref:Cell division protein FtsX n=1 Tax=Sinanaerobacter chloroacetimidivorans TaxID=2818044 RepID=A0A8J7W402_9FIRM|nr:permease-like cell division protein FtsX [Sinanaerobacter chloroacetimidivorans]MBR0598933.1 permease-like cell division protein FtsX [Sinanaerobacter chloroacetimidivorans]
MLNSIGCAIKQAFKQVFRNRTMTMASMFSITAMLLILGLFFILVVNINMVSETAKKQFDTIQVYLLDETSYEDAVVMMENLNQMSGVGETTYLTDVQAMAEWKAKWGDNAYLLDGLENNPLPNSILIKVTELEAADAVVAKVKTFDGIEDIKYYKSTVDQLMKVTNFVQIGALIVIVFLVIVSVVVVSNTIKLTVLAREREISIMKYVGATNWFIRGPFLIEGILIGILSALVSAGLVSLVYYKITELIGQEVFVMLSTNMVPGLFLVYNLVWIFVALGVSIGACGSIVSMRRFLDT